MATDWPTAIGDSGIRHDEHVADAPVISLAVIMCDELPDGGSECLFTEQNHPVQAALLNTPDEPFGVAV